NAFSIHIKSLWGLVYQDSIPMYVLALLAKVGIRRWAPDLNASSDTLYKEACRISAIQTFRQLAAGGAFEYMNINLRFLEDLQLLEAT
ncbi:hypothetical protein O181_119833, partial [Austropuccinia psidii MF-1]|nr:hypothetical protein [Austropuccinia psidii MF-1]